MFPSHEPRNSREGSVEDTVQRRNSTFSKARSDTIIMKNTQKCASCYIHTHTHTHMHTESQCNMYLYHCHKSLKIISLNTNCIPCIEGIRIRRELIRW